MTKCRDCGKEIVPSGTFALRCKNCSKKKTAKRKYQRMHEHRKKLGKLR